MKVLGIITEYNPFHSGHQYHIQEAKRLSSADLVIAIMSPNIVQRGEFAIIDKYRRTKVALENGVDIVIELPSIYVLQSATQFAYGAVKLLNAAGIDCLLFGSESNNLPYLKKLADHNFNLDYVKEILATGVSFPYAMGRLTDSLPPNDLLAVAYLRELIKYPNISPLSLQRTNNYHQTNLGYGHASASAIRNVVFTNQKIDHLTPLADLLKIYRNSNDLYYELLQYQILTTPAKELSSYLLVDEGIENHLIKQFQSSSTYQDAVNKCTNKRYTKSRIQRTLLNILFKNKKTDKENLESLEHLRILGFNALGQNYLKHLENYSVKFTTIPKNQRDLEYKIAQVYQLKYPDKTIVSREISAPIILK